MAIKDIIQRNYGYIDNYGEPCIICTSCGHEMLLHDGFYECSVCGYDGWDGEEKVSFDENDK